MALTTPAVLQKPLGMMRWGVFFRLLLWRLAAALGGWLGNLTQEQV